MSVLLRGPFYKKQNVPTSPAYRAGSTGTQPGNGSAGNLTVTIPSAAVVGDLALFCIVSSNSNTLTAPSGYKQVGYWPGQADTNPRMYLFTKPIATGDPGLTITFTKTGTDAAAVLCVVYSNAQITSIPPSYWEASTGESGNNRQMRCPSAIGGAYDIKVGFAAMYAWVSLALNAAQMTAAPTGCTIRQTANVQANSTVLAYSVGSFDGPPTVQHENITVGQAHVKSLILTLGPVTGSTAQTDLGPSSLVNKPVLAYTTSMNARVVVPEATYGYGTITPWGDRIAVNLGGWSSTGAPGASGSNNMAMCGAYAADICTAAYGSHTDPTRAVNSDPLAVNQACTFTAQTTPGLVLIDPCANDLANESAGNNNGKPRSRTAVQNSVDALVRLVRSSSVKAYNDSTIAYTGSWSVQSSDGLSGGSANMTTTPGDKVTITTTQQNVDVIMVGGDNSNLGNVGATFTVTVNGTVVATINGNNTMVATGGGGGLGSVIGSSNFPNYKFAQFAYGIRNMPSGTNTIVITHASNSGDRMIFNCWLQPASNPPWVVLNAMPPWPSSSLTSLNCTTADLAAYATILKNIAAQFPDGKVIVYDPFDTMNVPSSTTEYASDGFHGLEEVHAWYAHEIMRRLNERIP